MAHPLALAAGKSISIYAGPGTLLKRPELAALIGSICSDWAYLESSLRMFYAHLMGVYLDPTPGYELPSHPVANQIFEEIQTINSRIQLVRKLAEWVIKDEQQKNEVLDVLDKLKKAGKGRNTVAHAVWGICDSEPDALILLPTFGHKLIYKKRDFETIIEQIKSANKELGCVHQIFYQERKKQTS